MLLDTTLHTLVQVKKLLEEITCNYNEYNNVSNIERLGRFTAIDKISGLAYLVGYGPS